MPYNRFKLTRTTPSQLRGIQESYYYESDDETLSEILAAGYFAGFPCEDDCETIVTINASDGWANVHPNGDGGESGLVDDTAKAAEAKADAALAAAGANLYYVDSVNGLDSNDGLSKSAPFQTLTKLNTVLASGLNAYLNRSSVFYDSISATGSNIGVYAYGAGDKPIIDCSDALTASDFSKTGGQTNVYEATITLPTGSKISGNIYLDGVAVKQVASIALCDAEANTAYVTDWTAASATLYVHKDGTAPLDTDYRYTARAHAIELTGDNNEIIGVTGIKNANQDGSFKISGLNSYIKDSEMNDGCRHSAYFQAGCYLDSAIFKGGRNDLEGAANTLVINQPLVAGESYNTANCVFDADGDPRVTGPQNHGADANELFAIITHTNPTFIGLEQSIDVAAQDTQVINPTFDECTLGLFFGRLNGVAAMTGATGTTNEIFKAESSFTVTTKDSVLTCPNLGVGFYKAETTSADITIDNDVITVIDADLTSRFFRVQGGTISVINSEFKPSIAFPCQTFYNCGYDGGTIAYTGENNVYPFGAKFLHNGTTYDTLADFKLAAGVTDTTSTTAELPSPTVADSFGRADGALEQGLWSYQGASGQASIASTNVSITGTSLSLYHLPPLSSPNHYARVVIGNNNAAGPMPVAVRAEDEQNWIGVRWSTSQFQMWRSVGGSLGQIGTSSGVTPTVDDELVLAVRGKYAYLYVNGNAVINRLDIGTDLVNGKLCGLVTRSTAVASVIKEFSCGVI